MSNFWDPSTSQPQQLGEGGQPVQQVGNVKLFDPTQFQTGPQHTGAQGDQTHQHPQNPGTGAYFTPDHQHGQNSAWDSWNSWGWGAQDQQTQGNNQSEGQSNTVAGEGHISQLHHVENQQQGGQVMDHQQYYNPQQFQNGSAETNPNSAAQDSSENYVGHTQTFNGHEWHWDGNQGLWVPADGSNMNQQQVLPQQGQDNQGHHFYGQESSFNSATWNNVEAVQGTHFSGADPFSQQSLGQEGGQAPQAGQAEQVEQPSNSGQPNETFENVSLEENPFPSATGSIPANSHVGESNKMATSSCDIANNTSYQQVPAEGQVYMNQGHGQENSVNPSADNATGLFGDEKPAQSHPSLPPASSVAPMEFLNVTSLQRTDSGISNASLQTFNTSADEEDLGDDVKELAHQMGTLQMGGEQVDQQNKSMNSLTAQEGAPQQYAHQTGISQHGSDTVGLEEPTVYQVNVPQLSDRDVFQQNPQTNDWQNVSSDAHLTSFNNNSSVDNGITFSAKSQQEKIVVDDKAQAHTQGTPSEQGTSAALCVQDSESSAGRTSSGPADSHSSLPNSEASLYHPAASSTPLTSPGGSSALSPSSLQSPQQCIAAVSAISPVVPPSANNQQTEGDPSNTASVVNNPGEIVDASQSKEPYKPVDDVNVSRHTTGANVKSSSHDGAFEKPPIVPSTRGSQSDLSKEKSQSSRRHHSAFHPIHGQRAKHNMSPATTLWDNTDTVPAANILLAPAAPLIIPSLGANPSQSEAVTTGSSTTTSAAASTTTSQSTLKKSSSNSSSLEKLSSREVERKGRDRDGGRYGGYRRRGERNGSVRNEELSRSREEDNRSMGSLDELDATPDYSDDFPSRAFVGSALPVPRLNLDFVKDLNDRNRRYGRDPRHDAYGDWSSGRSESYREDYRRPRDAHYRGYRDPYYDEKYDRPRSRQDEERSSRPSSRSARDMDLPRSRAEYERDRDGYGQPRDGYRRDGYADYDHYGRRDYYYDDRDRYYGYYRDDRYRHGYAEEMGQYYGHPQHYDSRYYGYYGYPPPLPPLPQHPYEDVDQASIGSLSRGQTPAVDEFDLSSQDYYGRPGSRVDRDREAYGGYGGYGGYQGGGYSGGYYDQYQYQYPYYNYPQYGEQQQQDATGYQQGRMTPPKYLLPHVRVSFGPTGQLVTVLPTRPAEGQPATVDIHDVQVMLQDRPEVEEFKTFPGPLVRNETHKNDVLLYCQTKARECAEDVDMLDRESAELIWHLLELLLKQNGTVIGTDIADLLLAGHEPSTHEYSVSGIPVAHSQSSDPLQTPDRDQDSRSSSPAVKVTTDRTIITASQQLEDCTDRFRNLLLYGRKKEALDWAMKRNLWGHALFLASKMDNRTHASVMTRFANTAMKMNDPLQTLYQLMSGRQPAAVTNVVDERWGHWRPHLAMMLANHSSRPDLDKKSIITLGDTLAIKHCLHASHFCYLMAQVEFGSFFRKASKIVLLGANHNLALEEFYTNAAIQCTEVYEYAQSLGNAKFCLSEFQVYKFLYACRLAEYGFTQEAFHYLEVITLQVLTNPGHYHPAFVTILYSLSSQLKHGDPQKMHAGHDSADPSWLIQLGAVCQGYEEGSIQYQPGSATPMTAAYGGTGTPSSESGEMAGYGVDGGSSHGAGYLQDSGSYTHNSYGYQQTQPEGTAGQGDGTGQQQQQTATDQYGQYTDSQQAAGDQYSWQQQQQQQQELSAQPQQQYDYDPSQYQQQWQGYDASQGYGGQTAEQPVVTGHHGDSTHSGTDPSSQPSHQQPYQHQDNQGAHIPQQESSLTTHTLASTPPEGGAGEEGAGDKMDGEAVSSGPRFDYFLAASNAHKIVPPASRYRSSSTQSTDSMEQRDRRASVSSTGSTQGSSRVTAPPPVKPAHNQSKKDNSQTSSGGGGGGWLGGLFSFGRGNKNEIKLPDDKNPSIVWDPVKKTWFDKDGNGQEATVAAPPPTDTDLMGKSKPSSATESGSTAAMNGPPSMNRFSRPKGQGARGQYVDVLNPSGGSGTKAVPSGLFNVMPTTSNGTSASSAPQLFNPSAVSSASSSQTSVPSNQNSAAPPSQDAQELGRGEPSKPADPAVSSQLPQSMPMLFNPAQLPHSSTHTAAPSSSGMKYGHRRVYPK